MRHAERGAARRRPRRSRSSTSRPACWPTRRRSWPRGSATSSPTRSAATSSARPPRRARAASRGTTPPTQNLARRSSARRRGAAPVAARAAARRSETAKAGGHGARRRSSQRDRDRLHRRLHAAARRRATTASLAALVSTFTILAGRRLGAAGRRRARDRAAATSATAGGSAATIDALAAAARSSPTSRSPRRRLDPARADRRARSPCPSTRGPPRRSSRPAIAVAAARRVLRGALQGLHALRGRSGSASCSRRSAGCCCGLVLVLAGAGVTGAFLGTPLARWSSRRRDLPRAAAPPDRPARRGRRERSRTLRSLIAGGWAPIVGLTLPRRCCRTST